MGLCKCPRKKVTNLFCFEHRVNVCEYCTVEDHPNCIVQSYLTWLQDSDYDPNCYLCGKSLNDVSPTVRLLCLHLYHWQCLDQWARRFPPNTAPAGFRCPVCSEPLFPKPNQRSPLVAVLKDKLEHVSWAKAGFGQSFAHSNLPLSNNDDFALEKEADTVVSALDADNSAINPRKTNLNMDYTSNANHFIGNLTEQISNDMDNPDVKYKRRSAFDWLSRWIKSKQASIPRRTIRPWSCKRIFFYTLLIVIGLMTVITILSRLGRSHFGALDNDDPLFDPAANPNIQQAGPDDIDK